MASRSMESFAEDDLFLALAIFVSQIRIFNNLERFGECFGKVLGVFGDDFVRFLARFFEVLGNASLMFGNSSLHAFQNNRAAKHD